MSLIKNLAIAATVIGVAACTAFIAPKVSRGVQLKKLFEKMGGADFTEGATTDVEKKLAMDINEMSSEYLLSGRMESYTNLEALCLTLKAHFYRYCDGSDGNRNAAAAAVGPANDSTTSQDAAAA